MNRTRLGIVLLLLALGAGLAGILFLEHNGIGTAAIEGLCGVGDEDGCARISDSAYSAIGGVSLAAIGLFSYVSLFALLALAVPSSAAVARRANALALYVLGLAVIVDAVLLGIQALAIGAFCTLCLGTYAVNAAACYLLLPGAMPLASVTELRGSHEGRRLLQTWASTSLVVLLALALAESYGLSAIQ